MVTSGFYDYHGYQWLPVVFYGYQWFLWLSWLCSGYQWFSIATRDCRWLPVVFMVIMVISGYQWFSMATRDCIGGYQWFLWLSIVLILWSPLVSMVTRDCTWLSVIVDVVGVFMIISGKSLLQRPSY